MDFVKEETSPRTLIQIRLPLTKSFDLDRWSNLRSEKLRRWNFEEFLHGLNALPNEVEFLMDFSLIFLRLTNLFELEVLRRQNRRFVSALQFEKSFLSNTFFEFRTESKSFRLTSLRFSFLCCLTENLVLLSVLFVGFRRQNERRGKTNQINFSLLRIYRHFLFEPNLFGTSRFCWFLDSFDETTVFSIISRRKQFDVHKSISTNSFDFLFPKFLINENPSLPVADRLKFWCRDLLRL